MWLWYCHFKYPLLVSIRVEIKTMQIQAAIYILHPRSHSLAVCNHYGFCFLRLLHIKMCQTTPCSLTTPSLLCQSQMILVMCWAGLCSKAQAWAGPLWAWACGAAEPSPIGRLGLGWAWLGLGPGLGI